MKVALPAWLHYCFCALLFLVLASQPSRLYHKAWLQNKYQLDGSIGNTPTTETLLRLGLGFGDVKWTWVAAGLPCFSSPGLCFDIHLLSDLCTQGILLALLVKNHFNLIV